MKCTTDTYVKIIIYRRQNTIHYTQQDVADGNTHTDEKNRSIKTAIITEQASYELVGDSVSSEYDYLQFIEQTHS